MDLHCVQRGRERKRPQSNHPEISSQKVADFERGRPYDSYGKNRASFWPFLGEGFWGNMMPISGGPFFSWSFGFTADKPRYAFILAPVFGLGV